MVAPIEISVFYSFVVGAVFAGGLYCISVLARRGQIDFRHSFHAVAFGLALGGAFHLMYAAVYPDQLVEVFTKDERRLRPPEIDVHIDGSHRAEIFVGGLFLFILACDQIWLTIRHPTKKADDSPPLL